MNLLDQNQDQLEIDPNKNYLEELVGEGKKFSDPEALAKGKYVADHYISTLERSLDELREDYAKVLAESKAGQNVQALLDKLEGKLQDPPSRENTNTSNEDIKLPTFDPSQVESLISSKIQQHEQTKKETENFNSVQNKVKERFGNDYKTILKQKADALGLTDNDVNLLARSNPNLFYKTFDVNEQSSQGFQAPPRSDRRSDNFAPTGGEKRTMSYYQKMRKQNPLLYNDPKIRVQMDKDAQTLGMDFFDV